MTGDVEHENSLSEKILVPTVAIDAHYVCSNTGSSGMYN
jgi:hypothetical protein